MTAEPNLLRMRGNMVLPRMLSYLIFSEVKDRVTMDGEVKMPLRPWKRLMGKNPEGKHFRKLLRRKPSSAKISKMSRNTLKFGQSDIVYLLKNLLKISSVNTLSSANFSEVFALCVLTLRRPATFSSRF